MVKAGKVTGQGLLEIGAASWLIFSAEIEKIDADVPLQEGHIVGLP